METVKDWIRNPHGGNVWFHGLDALGHILRADPEAVSKPLGAGDLEFYEGQRDRLLSILRSSIEQYERDGQLDKACEEVFSRPRRRTRQHAADDGDDVHVDGYVGGNRREFFLRSVREESRHKPALSIVFEAGVPGAQSRQKWMLDRHAEAYSLALQAEREGRPCRVVAVEACTYKDRRELGVIRTHTVIKDWSEPMFPALWGVFKDNQTANAYGCLLPLCIVGGDPGSDLGKIQDFTLDSFPDGEEVVILGAPRFMRPGPSCRLYTQQAA